jgi:hypothetical protein
VRPAAAAAAAAGTGTDSAQRRATMTRRLPVVKAAPPRSP